MAEKLIAVPESNLIEIGDAIRLKRDITTPIPVADMAMQIGLIEGGGGELVYEQIVNISNMTNVNNIVILDTGLSLQTSIGFRHGIVTIIPTFEESHGFEKTIIPFIGICDSSYANAIVPAYIRAHHYLGKEVNSVVAVGTGFGLGRRTYMPQGTLTILLRTNNIPEPYNSYDDGEYKITVVLY